MATTTVKLDSKQAQIEGKEFAITHAEAVLNLQAKNKFNTSDWQLSPNQAFEYKDGSITSTGKGKDKESGK